MRRFPKIIASLVCVCITGCPLPTSTLPPATSGGGWILSTGYIDAVSIAPAPETTVSGVWVTDNSGAAGDPSSFEVTTNDLGLFPLPNARVNASWQLTWVSSLNAPLFCDGVTATALPEQGHVEEFNCINLSGGGEALTSPVLFNPNPFNTAAPPSSVTITGSGFDPTYGMPVAQYFDMNGSLVAQQSATSVSPDRTTLAFSTPNFAELPDGTYAGVVSNIASDGSYSYVGTAAVNVPAPFYRPTQYSDIGGDPTLYPTQVYSGPGSLLESYTNYNYVPGGQYIADVEYGDCTWFGFPSHTDSSALTLYIPYTPSTSGYYGYFNMEADATIGGVNTILYAGGVASTPGVLTATIPAGTNISTIRVHVNVSTFDDGLGNPLDDSSATVAVDIYIQ